MHPYKPLAPWSDPGYFALPKQGSIDKRPTIPTPATFKLQYPAQRGSHSDVHLRSSIAAAAPSSSNTRGPAGGGGQTVQAPVPKRGIPPVQSKWLAFQITTSTKSEDRFLRATCIEPSGPPKMISLWSHPKLAATKTVRRVHKHHPEQHLLHWLRTEHEHGQPCPSIIEQYLVGELFHDAQKQDYFVRLLSTRDGNSDPRRLTAINSTGSFVWPTSQIDLTDSELRTIVNKHQHARVLIAEVRSTGYMHVVRRLV